ncbi:DUF1700 domain-containing protein [Lactobacillus panisapium]|uniref:DUF1700 domain-containing protein n=1 Tax=Lactobacillus panisapium TaxID=2012495 RepID=UPI001C6A4824|nr:DUF1700 domain-containing protein [Lactobacillus panisapium]QYN55091.1 DUF1700 domain-containing protein [Lactobacillus panisapium]
MNKIIENYISKLSNNLSALPYSDRQDVIEFYQEFLFDGDFKTEQDIVDDLGTPKMLARKVLADYSISDKDNQQPRNASSKSNLKTIWVILLGVLAAPIGIPLAILAVLLMILILLIFCAVFIAITLAITGLFITGALILCKSFGLIFTINWSTGLFYSGAGIMLICVGLLLFPLLMRFIRFLIAECTTFFRFLGKKIFKKQYYKTNSKMKTEK